MRGRPRISRQADRSSSPHGCSPRPDPQPKARTIFPPTAFLIRNSAYHSSMQPRDTALFRLQIAGRIGFLLHDEVRMPAERHGRALVHSLSLFVAS